MVSNNPANKSAQPQASLLHAPAAGTADPAAVMNPGGTIDVASTGDGVPTDPSGKDKQPPPGVTDYNFDLLA